MLMIAFLKQIKRLAFRYLHSVDKIDSALLKFANVRLIMRRAPETIRADQKLRPVHPRIYTVHPGNGNAPDRNGRP